jgi:transposase InsO family protein
MSREKVLPRAGSRESFWHLALYVILDVYSRYVMGWIVANGESAELAKGLIADSCAKQKIDLLPRHYGWRVYLPNRSHLWRYRTSEPREANN